MNDHWIVGWHYLICSPVYRLLKRGNKGSSLSLPECLESLSRCYYGCHTDTSGSHHSVRKRPSWNSLFDRTPGLFAFGPCPSVSFPYLYFIFCLFYVIFFPVSSCLSSRSLGDPCLWQFLPDFPVFQCPFIFVSPFHSRYLPFVGSSVLADC